MEGIKAYIEGKNDYLEKKFQADTNLESEAHEKGRETKRLLSFLTPNLKEYHK